jgi:hypothetical protein
MTTPEASSRNGRETRLLLVTIAVSVGVLLLLARFRFPDTPAGGEPVDSAPAPLERLAARAAYDELASIMADLERRIAPRVTIVQAQAPDGQVSLLVAPRLTPDRAVALLRDGETIVGAPSGGLHEVISHAVVPGVAVMRVPAVDDSAVSIRQGALRPGPRYVGVVEAAAVGPALRPVYVGRMDGSADPQTGIQLLSLTGVQHALPRGAAVFSLEGAFLGLVRESGSATVLVSAESLRGAAETAQPAPAQPFGHLGVAVDSLTAGLRRATGAEQGVVVVRVETGGPAEGVLRSGDVIQTMDGVAVTSVAAFHQAERGRAPGADVAVTGLRRRSPLSVSVRAGAGANPEAQPRDDPGFVGRTVPGAGIEVVTVREGSAAAHAGLQRGDLIVAVDGDRGDDVAALTRRFRAAASGAPFLFTVQRGQQHRVLALEKQ